jgi:glycosyltransferase involved in cell wall biosynthesis
MRAAAEEPDLRGRVRFLGSRSDIPDFLASLDLFLLPARAEPFGIVVIEAMAASLPVIASKVGGIPEILSAPEIGRLVDPLTPEAFARAVREILALPDRGKSMGAKARLSLMGRFDMAAAGERLKKIYLDVLGSAPARR